MSSQQTFSSDLRSGAKEFTRDKTHRVKWAHGQAFGPGRRVEENRPRPARPGFNRTPVSMIREKNREKTRGAAHYKARANDMSLASGESSTDDDIEEPSAAPAPDADVAYSFDAERGPNHGSQILNQALAKAVERYEVRQTDKLIKEEYEVLDVNGALSPAPKPRKKNVAPEDEDYEFIEV